MAIISASLRPNRRPLAAVALLTTAALVVGCGSESDLSEPVDNAGQATVRNTLESCRARLDGAIDRVRPDTLRAITDVSAGVDALNAWLVECAAEELNTLRISEENLAFLDSTAQRAASGLRFTARDATYVRDSLILAELVQAIVGRSNRDGNDSQVARLVRVFRWVGNNIGLETAGEASAPKSFLDTLLTGRGSMRSRVWLFASLLRQLQRDVVILLPGDQEGEPGSDTAFLIAACLDDRLLLFDPLTWLPVPAAGDDSVRIDQPAGVEHLLADESWSQPQVRIVAEIPTVCPRMLILQDQLPVESSAILYEELAGGTSEIRPLLERVVSAAPDVLDTDNIAWWGWPDEQVTAAIASGEEEQRSHDALMQPFEAPFEREPLQLGTDFSEYLNQDGLTPAQRESLWNQRWEMERQKIRELQESGQLQKLFGRPSSRLLKTRLNQIEGSADQRIIQQLQKIRNACIDDAIRYAVPKIVDPSGYRSIPFPEAIQSVNRQAAGSALYWVGICQMDRGMPGKAIPTFESYRRQYSGGTWHYPSLMNQALAELAQKRPEAALKTLMEANQEANPEQRRAATLLQRLQATGVVLPDSETAPEDDGESTDEPQESDG